ncbi:MAG: DNA repair protein RadC [Pseudomonadota bacterium]
MKQQSNAELLALLVGNDTARALASRPLAEIFGFAKPRQQQLCEEMAAYVVHPALSAAKELLTRCFSEQLSAGDLCLTSPAAVQSFLCAQIGHLEHESFWCLWLDAQNRLIKAEELFRGTATQTSVYPREVVKQALALNATGVIFAHNHPSGSPEPSRADQMLTSQLKSALALVDVRTLDHFVIAGNKALSFSERGLL